MELTATGVWKELGLGGGGGEVSQEQNISLVLGR